jgi:segregation and condensation protein B
MAKWRKKLETDELRARRREVPPSQAKAGESVDAGATEASDDVWPDEKLKAVLESLLFAAGEPVSLTQLANALEEVPRDRIRKTLSEMAAGYAAGQRGFLLAEIAGGYQLRTPSAHAGYVRRLLSAKPPRLTRPVMETLAIVAYRQPMTRPEIEQLRGVDSGGVLETLVERNLIKIAGRKDAPGRPLVYTTTPDFLELFGLKDLESLPDLEEFRELEGLREPTGPPQAAPGGDSHDDLSHSGRQPDPGGRRVSNEPPIAQPVEQAGEFIGGPAVAGTTPSDAGPPPGASNSSRSENNN